MRDIIKLFLIVTIFSVIAGLALATVEDLTADRIELQELTYVRGPAIKMILAGCQNDPLSDRFKIQDGENEITFFIGEFNGKKDVVAFEVTGTGLLLRGMYKTGGGQPYSAMWIVLSCLFIILCGLFVVKVKLKSEISSSQALNTLL